MLLTPAPVGTPGAAVTSANNVSTPTTLTPGTGSGYAIGDTLLCFTACSSATPTVATPAGWTSILNVTGTNGRLALFAKVAASTSEAAPSVVWSGLTTGTSGTPCQAIVQAFTNVNNSVLASMTDVVGASASGTASTTTSSGGAAITTTADKDLVLTLSTRLDDAGTWTAPAGFTNVTAAQGSTSGADFAMGWAYQVKTTAGAVSAPSFGLTGASSFASTGVVVALKAYADNFYSQLILGTPGLVSYWRLNEPSGNALDSKGSSPATVAGGITRQVAGLLTGDSDLAMRSDGASGSYIRATGVPGSVPQLTFECWVKLESYVASSPIMDRSYPFLEQTSNTGFRWYVRDDNSVDTIIDTSSTVKVGQRQHLVGVYDAIGGSMKLYVDGVSVGTQNRTPNANTTNNTTFFILSDSTAGVGSIGTVDEVAVYTAALTAQQVLDHYNSGLGQVVASDMPTGICALSGTRTESFTPGPKFDAPTGIFRLSGSISAESYFNQGAIDWKAFRVRERPPLRVSMAAITPNGRHYRWAEDEPRAENIFNGLRWGSTMPGGHESCDCVLPRMPGVNYSDLDRFTTLQIVGAGGNVVGEFRLERTPQTSGDQMAISPSAVGWQAHLDDNKGVSIIFIDRDLGSWAGPPRSAQLIEIAGGYSAQGPNVMSDTVAPTLSTEGTGPWAVSARLDSEAWYDAGPDNLLGRLRATWTRGVNVSNADTNWVWQAFFGPTADYSNLVGNTGNLRAAGPGTIDLVATGKARYGILFAGHIVAGGSDNAIYAILWTDVRMFGNHGLTIRGLTPQTEGFLCSDVVGYAIGKWAPLLKVTSDSIQTTNFIIPQLAFKDNTTVSNIIKESTRFGLEDWAVWNDKTFYLNARNASPLAKRWRARIGPAKLEQTGQQADRLWESVLVQYNDVDAGKTTRVVGPPGSGADVEDSRLKDSDPLNPANVLGITRRDKLMMGVGTASGAIEVGRRFLEEQKAVDRSGRASLVGHVEDDHGILFPYTDVKAGDSITFVDAADTSYRRIVKADHDNAAKAATVDLDAPPEGLQAVLDRLGVSLAPLGL